MKKKILSTVMLVATLGVLTSCSSNTSTSTDSSSQPADTTTTTETETTETETTEEVTTEDVTPNEGDPIVVSSMNDVEGEILGSMIVLSLENAGYEVTDKVFDYAGTANGRTAILEGETDVFVAYTGSGMYLIEGVDEALFHDMEKSWEAVSEFDKENGLTWLRYAPFNNTDALAVTKEFAAENDVYDMYDFARYVNEGGYVNMMTHTSYITQTSGLPGLEEAYGFKLTEDQYGVNDISLAQTLYEGIDGVNVAHVYTSGGIVKYYELVVLEDPENVAPVYCPAPIIRTERLEAYPEVETILNEVFESITLEEMVSLNAQVQVDGRTGKDVAKEYLLSKNLIQE
ncbi:MAG: glycine betaine ABC transporter substrate-binding protein [Lachnospirales bacterium]